MNFVADSNMFHVKRLDTLEAVSVAALLTIVNRHTWLLRTSNMPTVNEKQIFILI